MSNVLVDSDSLTAIANAIRSKNSSATKYKPGEMAAAINDITTGAGDDGYSVNEMKALMDRSLTSFRFPEGITKIGDSFFQDCHNLALTSLPEGITEIGDSAFYDCSKITLTSLPEGITKINNFVFSFCNNLTLNKLPDNLNYIGMGAFSYTNITISEIPAGITEINFYPFQYCKKITTFKLHAGIKKIGYNGLAYMPGLTTVTFEGTPDSIDSSAFNSCTALTTINVPWAEGAVAGAPWGATKATINYNYVGGEE